MSDEDSLLENDESVEASPGDALGNIDSPPVHYDRDEQSAGYDDLLSESDVRL